MPLFEEFDQEVRSVDEIQYGKAVADKIQLSLKVREHVEQRHQAYFEEREAKLNDFLIARWNPGINGMETFISGDLRSDIAQEVTDELAKVWS